MVEKMKEKIIEQYLVDEVEKLGGIAYKFKSPGRKNVPDRLCIFPNNIHAFVECKATGEEPTEAQYREINRLRRRGHWATWVDSKYLINIFIHGAKLKIKEGE